MTVNKYKVIAWGSVATGEITNWGIQIKVRGEGPWMHCYENGPLLFSTKKEAAAKVKDLKVKDALRLGS